MAKINGDEIKPGFVLDHGGGLWVATKVNHVKPGKSGAFAQVEIEELARRAQAQRTLALGR